MYLVRSPYDYPRDSYFNMTSLKLQDSVNPQVTN